jgi:hypothetical protein
MNTRLTLLGSALFALALLASPVRADDGESCPGCPSKKPKVAPAAPAAAQDDCGKDCDKGKKKCEPKTSVEQGDCDDCGCKKKKKKKGADAPAETAPAA